MNRQFSGVMEAKGQAKRSRRKNDGESNVQHYDMAKGALHQLRLHRGFLFSTSI